MTDTTKADIEAAGKAWEEARDAVMKAWQLTPEYLLQHRTPVPAKSKDQTIAYTATDGMMKLHKAALNAIDIQRYARKKGLDWATATDEEAARGEAK